ncbi:MAG: hypothetical protein LBS21_06195 [Clostridiales bacterium]|jgi:gas vesicle protein|nr:hypothetical protein [Clostridiales bacterium]
MKEERMYILQMLGEGKISADEAAKLLEAVGKKPMREYWDEDFNAEEKIRKFSQSVESFAKDFGSKIEHTFKDMEPKVRSTTKKVMEKTASVVDDISKALYESIKNLEPKEPDCGANESADTDEEPADDEPREN